MAVGDFGSFLDDEELLGTYYGANICHIYDNVYMATGYDSGGDGLVQTFSVDKDTGVITVIDGETYASTHISFPFHISGTVYGLWHDSEKLTTINVSNEGVIGSTIQANMATGAGATIRSDVLNVSGTIFAAVFQHSTNGFCCMSFNIAANGSSVSLVDASAGDSQTQNIACGFIEVTDNVFAGVRDSLNRHGWVLTWNIDDDGNITSVDSQDLGYNGNGTYCGIARAAGSDIFVISNNSNASPAVQTIDIDSDGNIGSVLDTDIASLFGSYILTVYWAGDDIFYAATASYLRSFHVNVTTGAIGSAQDTLTSMSVPDYNNRIIHVYENIWAIVGEDAGVDYHIATFDVESDVPPEYSDRIYVWLGTEDDPLQIELTDPDYPTALGVRTERGRNEELGHAASGICEVTCDNQFGDFSPEKTDGQYYGSLVLGAYITVFEVYGGTIYYHFSGKIDKITPHPEPDNLIAFIVAIDGMDDLAGSDIETVLRSDTDDNELLEDILDAASWSATKRDLDAGVDTLQLGWFHAVKALPSIQDLEDTTRGFFLVDTQGNAIWQNRHYRVTGDRLTSQFTFNETLVQIAYEWSKRDVRNWCKVVGYKYIDPYYGLPEETWIYSAPTNFDGAPFVAAGETIILWGDLTGPMKQHDTLVKGTHWNANTAYDKSGTDVSDDITLTVTDYGQSIKFEIENTGTKDAYLVVPDTPPSGAPENSTLLTYGTIYEEKKMTVIEEDTTSRDNFGRRTLSVDAKFKSNYNDVIAYAKYLLARYKDPLPTPIKVVVDAWTDFPDDTIKLQCLTRGISDRVTVISSKLGVNQDYYIDKIIQEYALYEGGAVHRTTYVLSRAEGQAEGQYWLLGETGFSELGETTVLGF